MNKATGIIGAIILAMGIMYLQIVYVDKNDSQEVKTICYDNVLYIKFNEGRAAWGTFVPNEEGKPVHCSK